MPLIAISEETKSRFDKIGVQLSIKRGKQVTYEAVADYLCGLFDTDESGVKP